MQAVLEYLAGGRALLLHTASKGIIAIFILVKGVFYIYSIVQAYNIHVTKIDSFTALWQYALKKKEVSWELLYHEEIITQNKYLLLITLCVVQNKFFGLIC